MKCFLRSRYKDLLNEEFMVIVEVCLSTPFLMF